MIGKAEWKVYKLVLMYEEILKKTKWKYKEEFKKLKGKFNNS